MEFGVVFGLAAAGSGSSVVASTAVASAVAGAATAATAPTAAVSGAVATTSAAGTIAAVASAAFEIFKAAVVAHLGHCSALATGTAAVYYVSLANLEEDTPLDDYIMTDDLGHGAFGEVKKCIEKASGTTWAVKSASNISTEIEVMARLSEHSNIACLHDVFRQAQRSCLVMTFCPGETLREELFSDFADTTEPEIARPIKHILEGLQHLHSQAVCHRDLKPENIMYCKLSGSLRSIDFGLARTCAQGTMKTITGTLGYTVPEVLRGSYIVTFRRWASSPICSSLKACSLRLKRIGSCGAVSRQPEFSTKLMNGRSCPMKRSVSPRACSIGQLLSTRARRKPRVTFGLAIVGLFLMCELVTGVHSTWDDRAAAT